MPASQNDKDPYLLTQNTANLRAMLESVNQEDTPSEKDVFDLDFKEVLNLGHKRRVTS